jgi:peptide/nickel transport system substrate-binding protein
VLGRREALQRITIGALITLGAACGPLDLPHSPLDATPQVGARPGRTLRIGVLGDIPNLDPHQLGPPVPDVTFPIWDRLIEYDAQVQPRPSLAESWDPGPDGQQLTLRLRSAVEFHSGRELTADDVKWTFTRLQTDPIVRTTGFFSQVQPLASVDVLDKYRLVLKSDAPWPGVFGLLSLMNVVDPVSMQAPESRMRALGTGPFVFSEWVQGDHVRLVRNPRYWIADEPRVDELSIHIYTDAQTMVSALEAGAIDIADKPALLDAARLQNDSHYHVVMSRAGGTRYALLFNAVSAPTDNQQFRQALLYAIDRQRIVDTVLHGFGRPSNLPFAVSSPAYDATRDRRYDFDLARAQSLVNASRAVNPAIDFNYSSVSKEWAAIGQIYQADLARIGVTLNLRPLEPVALVAELRARTFNGVMTGIVPLGGITPTQQAVDPYYSPVVSFSGFTSPTLTQLSNDLLHAVDPAARQSAYARWTDYALDQAWAGVVATSPPMAATTAHVHELKYSQLELLDYRDTWLDT